MYLIAIIIVFFSFLFSISGIRKPETWESCAEKRGEPAAGYTFAEECSKVPIEYYVEPSTIMFADENGDVWECPTEFVKLNGYKSGEPCIYRGPFTDHIN